MTYDEHSKGLEEAAIAAAKTPDLPSSTNYAVAREIWKLWWERAPIREHRQKNDPEMVKGFFFNVIGLSLMASRDMALLDENWGVVGQEKMVPFYDNIWREWMERPETDPVKQMWLAEAEKFLDGARGKRTP